MKRVKTDNVEPLRGKTAATRWEMGDRLNPNAIRSSTERRASPRCLHVYSTPVHLEGGLNVNL